MDSQDQVYDPLPDWYSADLARFISSCLAFHPEMRPDALRLFGQAQYHVVPSQGSLSRSLDLYDASLLTGAGFKIDSPHFDADAALLWSAKERIESITQRLLEKGADVNCKTLKGETPLLLACSSQSEHLNIVRLLLKKGAEINWEDEYGQTPLHRACNLGRVDLARLLLQTGAEVNATDSNLGRVDLARLLLQTGAEVNATDSNGMTPLHHARVPYRLEIAGLLLQRGAEVNAMDMDRETPLSCAIPYHWRTAKLLRQHGAKYEYLERSVLAIDLRNILFEESSASRRS